MHLICRVIVIQSFFFSLIMFHLAASTRLSENANNSGFRFLSQTFNYSRNHNAYTKL